MVMADNYNLRHKVGKICWNSFKMFTQKNYKPTNLMNIAVVKI